MSYPRAGTGLGAAGGTVVCRPAVEVLERFPVLKPFAQPLIASGIHSHPSPTAAQIMREWNRRRAVTWIHEALEHIRERRFFEATTTLEHVREIQNDLTPRLLRRYLYDVACVASRKAEREPSEAVVEELLDDSVLHLQKWISLVLNAAPGDDAEPYSELYHMSRDGDLHETLKQRRLELIAFIPEELQPAFAQEVPPKIVGRGGCFPQETPVLTPRGNVPIERIRPGDRILSFDPDHGFSTVLSRVASTHFMRSSRLVLIDDDVRTSPTQPLCDPHGIYISASDLRPGSQLRTIESACRTVRCVSLVTGHFGVYSLATDRAPHNYAASGIISHNFPKEIS